ncbi:MAG: thiamine pyrophosphate-dependent dehydrogenase E1 component subunit alpha, partial [Phaeodactylibacter sp.]|nr:thiamine pyrophosphate-dependent dehydrogenase E1 component subunit alpha [Phaeodactylibacter sp.]
MEKEVYTPSPRAFSSEEVLNDYFLCALSREVSLLIRREVLTGKAKFGVSDDGKELFQIAMAKVFQKGDFRADYYRGHTLVLALGLCTPEDLFAQLYADADNDPFSGGRQMNNHHATPLIDEQGNWLNHREHYNLSSDISTTGGQMARGIGLAMASKKYRESPQLKDTPFSNSGNEVVFCNIGDASTSEGAFWEVANAAGVQQVPLVMTVVDDGYGISVSREQQTTKDSISQAMEGLRAEADTNGIDIYHVRGWDYPALCEAYRQGVATARRSHRPILFHVDELTQPQGHSTSGSHERYKSKERLQWERENDCILRMEQWMAAEGIASPEETARIRKEAKKYVRECRDRAWKAFNEPAQKRLKTLQGIYSGLPAGKEADAIRQSLANTGHPLLSELAQNARRMYYLVMGKDSQAEKALAGWLEEANQLAGQRYHTHLYSTSPRAALKVPAVPARYSADAPLKNGFEILNAFFDKALAQYPELFAFGEDLGH